MFEGRDEVVIIQEDIKRALSRGNAKWAMLIDLRRCILCHACTAGCIAEQKSPPGIVYRPVYEEEMGRFPNVKRRFTPRPCMQCDDPPCVEACPNKGEGKATWKSTKGISAGVVVINYENASVAGAVSWPVPIRPGTWTAGLFTRRGLPELKNMKKRRPGNTIKNGPGKNIISLMVPPESVISVCIG